jgi:regulatory protein
MAGTITSLEIQKNNKERVNVYLDEEYAFPVTVLVAATLKKGQFLSDDEIAQLNQQDERDKAYNQALFFLGFRARSRVEVERYLRNKKYSPEAISDTLQRLAEGQFLDDTAFAQAWVEDRERFKPRSRQALQYELRQKGVEAEAIEEALEDINEDELAWRAVEGKVRQWQRLPEPDFKKKAMGFLSRRGFGYEVAQEATDRAWAVVSGTADSEELS